MPNVTIEKRLDNMNARFCCHRDRIKGNHEMILILEKKINALVEKLKGE